MSKMKNIAIELANEIGYDDTINVHNNLIQTVNESGLPYWMTSMYDNYLHLLEEQQEVESRALENPMMGYIDFTHSDEGENYHAYFGNWADAYQSYRNDKLNPL